MHVHEYEYGSGRALLRAELVIVIALGREAQRHGQRDDGAARFATPNRAIAAGAPRAFAHAEQAER